MSAAATSPFRVRGVLEGFYGRPWTHAQRLDMIRFIAARGMNTFAYAPKDDRLHRRDWRLPYAGSDLERLSELAETCRRHEVDFLYCLSPGLSIRYSSQEDQEALSAKFASVAELGVRWFGLLLDDIPSVLQHPADRAAFRELVDGQIQLVGRVWEALGPDRRLIVGPTVYWGYGDEEYLTRLGRGIDPRIDLFWSGRAICAPTIDLPDAATFARSTGRPPTYWDNYPVNDLSMRHELHIGPYRGRDPHLHRFATGVIANGMEYFESSKIPYSTIADYLADPEAYDAEQSWQRAMRDVVGEADLEAFALFADNVRFSCLSAEDSPTVTRTLETFTFESEYGAGPEAAGRELQHLADRLLVAADHLLRGPVVNRALIDEARPWIAAFEVGAQALACMAQLAQEGGLERRGRQELLPYLQRLREARVRVFGDVLDMTLSELTAPVSLQSDHGPAERGGTS